MKIKEIISQHRRDFRAIYICEYCSTEKEMGGYDDKNFHDNVIPTFECTLCGKKDHESYIPMKPKYPEGFQI